MRRALLILLLSVSLSGISAHATELYFVPDSSHGGIGDTIEIVARIDASETLRGFTIYMYYDTTLVDLAAPPLPGSLIAGLPGLDFRYADHIVAAPDWLEVGGTIFGNSFWSGPGELFRLKLVFRGCADVQMGADFGMRRPDGSFIEGTFNPPVFFICDRVPMAPDSLTIYWLPAGAELRWQAVTMDTLSRPLFVPPIYYIHKKQVSPAPGPFTIIDSTSATTYTDLNAAVDQAEYIVTARE